MYCIRKVTDDLTWIGANDRRLAMFEGVYSVPYGVSYNSYLLTDEKTVLFDTVDKAVRHRFMENLAAVLGDRKLDYVIVQHMEPDHSAAIQDLVMLYPAIKIVCNAKTLAFIKQFHDFDIESHAHIVGEDDTLNTGKHELRFIMAPMVHWPEVMVTYDSTDKILFSADAFGCFGALNGALFADEVDFNRDYLDETRRYYSNIVGKYGTQVQALLKKAASLDIGIICPLHGFVWRKNFSDIISKYDMWSRYEPEEYGVMIAYASVYGNTENTAEILACSLREKGVKTVMFDVSVTPASEIIAAAFRWSHFVFASTTYNAKVFVTMEAFINDLTAHNIQNRTAAVIENGTWAATSGGLICKELSECKNLNILPNVLRIQSSLKPAQRAEIDAITDALIATFPRAPGQDSQKTAASDVDPAALFKLSYGLFILTARDGGKDNGCIINTAMQITESPVRLSIAVNKMNYTCGMIMKTGRFNLSVISESAPFRVFEQFGFVSGKNADKFAGCEYDVRSANGIRYIPQYTNDMISGKVSEFQDYGTHVVFTADVTEAFLLSDERSMTYQYYFDHVKPKVLPPRGQRQGYVCKICGYVYENDPLPENFVCPLCKHGAADFEKM